MKAWDDIIKTAMLGTGKSALTALPQALTDISSVLETNDKEDGLLLAASMLLNYKRAGMVFPETQNKLTYASPETYPPCSKRSADLLSKILSDNNTILLRHWLALSATKQQIAPPQLLPALLDRAKSDIGLRTYMAPIIGQRGLWLADLNSDWGFIGQNLQEIWENGKPEERKEALRQLRAHNPEMALNLVENSWKGENAAFRLEILKILNQNLSLKDESFLSSLLIDKGKNIKLTALDMLYRIKESNAVQTIWQTVKTWIGYKKTKVLLISSKEELFLSLPGSLPDALAELGFENQSNDKIYTDPEFWLLQVVKILPASFWAQELNLSTDKFLNLIYKNDQLAKFTDGFALGACRHHEKELAKALIDLKLDTKSKELIRLKSLFLDLIEILDDADKMNYFEKGICKLEYQFPLYILEYLEICQFSWSLDFSRNALKELKKEINSVSPYEINSLLATIAPKLGMYVNPSIISEKENFNVPEEKPIKSWDVIFNIASEKADIIRSFENK